MANNYKISLDAEIRNLKDITTQVQNVGKNLKVKIDVDSGNITKKTEKINKDLYTTITLTERLNKKTGEISTTQEVNYNHTKKLNDELKNRAKLEEQAGNASKKATDTSSSGLNKNLLSIENIKASMKTAIVRTIEWATSMFLVYSAMHKLKEAVNIVIALDNQMTNIRMVTGATNEEAKQLLKTFQGLAKETSSTTSEIAKSGEVWLRQGRSIVDTNTLIETSAVLSKVAFMESAKSAELLTSAINGYKIEAQDAMSVVDKMSAIDVNAATGTDELAEALQQTSASAQLAGLSLDKTLAYIATISEVTRQSGATIGQSLKTVFARINQVKLGKLVDDDTGEDVSRVETVLKEYNLTLRDTEGQFRDTGMVIDELAMKWVKLTSAEKSEIAEQFAGVRQKDKFLTLMNNYNRALELEEVSLNSAGSAMNKFNIYQESTQAKMSELKNEFEIFATKTIDSGLIKSIVELGKVFLMFANSDVGQVTLKLIAFTTILSLATKGLQLFRLEMMKDVAGAWMIAIQGMYFGTLGLTGAIKSLTVAMLKSPFFVPMAIIAGIITLTALTEKFSKTLEKQTEIVKEQANKLQELQGEYDVLMAKTDLTDIEDARLKLLQQEISATKELLTEEAKRQYEMGKGGGDKNKGSQWGYENIPKEDANVTTKLSESVKAYQELQSEVTNTAQAEYDRQLKLAELSKQMSIGAQSLLDLKEKGVELTSEDQNLINAIIKITEVQKEQANTSQEVHDSYAVSQQVVDDYVAELQYLDSVEKTVRDGGSLSLEQKDEFIKKYPQLTDQIIRTSEGWKIEASSLEILRVQALQTANDKISAEKADLENRKSVLLAKLKLDQAEIKSAQAVTNAMFARAKANPNFRGSSQGFGSPEQQELVNLFGQISEIDALIGQVGTISGGRVSGGKAPSTSQKKEKTQASTDVWKEAFDTQYKLLQHNLTMNKITESEYLTNLDKLYKKYFAGKKKYSEEFMQYEEEVYTKRLKLEEELVKAKLEKQKELLEKQTESINSLVDLVVDMIKQEKNTEKDYYKTLMDAEKERHDKVIENLQDEVESKKKLLEDELEGYRKIIESQLESLRIKESERDFNKDLVENQKELARLESELREVSTDDTAEGKAKKLALEEEIAKQRNQINELQHDREIELTEDSLNSELTKYEENIQSQLDEYDEYLKNEEERYTESLDNRLEDYQSYVDDIDTYLSKEGLLRQEANRRIETDGKNLYGQLTLYNSEYGKMSEDAMTTMWNTATGAMSAYEQQQMSVLDTLRTLSKEMNKVTSALGGEPIDTEVGTTAKGKQQLNQQKYLHDQMLIAQKTSNKQLEAWVIKQRLASGMNKFGEITQKFHDGGFVGGQPSLKSNESFAKVLDGEFYATPSQLDKFMKVTLPTMLGMKPSSVSGGSQDINVSVPITFTGNVDDGTMPLIQKVVKSAVNEAIGKINKTMGQTGQIRNAKAISI